MRLNKKLAAYGIVIYVSVLLAACASSTLKDQRIPVKAATTDAQLPTCGDLLIYYSELAAQTDIEKVYATTMSAGPLTDFCTKLRDAILLSMPGSDQQNDKEALELLQGMKRTGKLYGSDLQFSNMLLQHVSQRQDLREQIAAQKERLVKVETNNSVLRKQLTTLQSQLDQLKDIEVEIDKKERSLATPISD